MAYDSWSSFSVSDPGKTERFYSEILGFKVKKMDMGILELRHPGGNKIWAYPKKDHQPASFTVLNLLVEDIEKEVARLGKHGISMERYPEFGADENGIVRGDMGPPIAWFKDPSGNILAVMEGQDGS